MRGDDVNRGPRNNADRRSIDMSKKKKVSSRQMSIPTS